VSSPSVIHLPLASPTAVGLKCKSSRRTSEAAGLERNSSLMARRWCMAWYLSAAWSSGQIIGRSTRMGGRPRPAAQRGDAPHGERSEPLDRQGRDFGRWAGKDTSTLLLNVLVQLCVGRGQRCLAAGSRWPRRLASYRLVAGMATVWRPLLQGRLPRGTARDGDGAVKLLLPVS